MSVFNEITYIERNGLLYQLHWKNRFDPVTLTILAITATAAGTAMSIKGTLEQGKAAEKIAEQRAAIDMENAEATRRASVEEARIKAERGRRLLASQKGAAAAGGIMINQGYPLVIEAETKDLIAKDMGFGLERGRTESEAFRLSAGLEIATGKAAKRKSKFSAISQGLTGIGTIAFMGADAGLFTKAPNVGPIHEFGAFKAKTGQTLEGFGRSFISG